MKKQKYFDTNFGIIKKVQQPQNIIAHEPVPYYYDALRAKKLNNAKIEDSQNSMSPMLNNYHELDNDLRNPNSSNLRLNGNYQPSSLDQYNDNRSPSSILVRNNRASSMNKSNMYGQGMFGLSQGGISVDRDNSMLKNSQDYLTKY